MNNNQNPNGIPTFTPPAQPQQQQVPTFTPPAQPQQQVPTFTPPAAQQQAPTFTPPANQAPVFTPPAAPTFTPPRGPICYYHQDQPAVAKCARCGKFICQDCYDNYGVNDEQYQGQALCYDCCRELVADNVKQLTKNKNKIKFHFILSIIGMVIGFILGLSMGISAGSFGGGLVYGLIFAGIGGVFWSFVKYYFSCLWEAIKAGFDEGSGAGFIGAAIGFAIMIFVGIFKCIYYTIRNTIDYIVYLKETSGFIESDSAALQQMADYMEYTMIRNQNKGVDLETLLTQNSNLADNAYARMVQTQGEEQAEAALRGCVASINENGEIIRSFAA